MSQALRPSASWSATKNCRPEVSVLYLLVTLRLWWVPGTVRHVALLLMVVRVGGLLAGLCLRVLLLLWRKLIGLQADSGRW